jgi:hypothetical protein
VHQKSSINGEVCINYIRALNLGFDDKMAEEILMA